MHDIAEFGGCQERRKPENKMKLIFQESGRGFDLERLLSQEAVGIPGT
jgi:hypothetical protein